MITTAATLVGVAVGTALMFLFERRRHRKRWDHLLREIDALTARPYTTEASRRVEALDEQRLRETESE